MDLGHLEKLISSIDLKKEMVRSIAEYCVINNKENENEIAKILETEFYLPTTKVIQKIAILDVVSEIFLMTGMTQKKDTTFFKPLAQKARIFLESISEKVNEIKSQHLSIIPNMLHSWSIPSRELFKLQFMQKLKKTAEPIYQAFYRAEEEKKGGSFKNYSKNFLMDYETIKSYKPTSCFYDDYAKFQQVSKEIILINNEVKKVGLEQITPEVKNRAKELQTKIEREIEQISDLVCNFHTDLKIMREECAIEFERLPNELKEQDNQ